MIASLACYAVSAVFLGDPSPFHEAVEARLKRCIAGGPTGRDVAKVLADVGVPPGNYATGQMVYVTAGSYFGNKPAPWKRPGVKWHEWYTNKSCFTVYYGPDHKVVYTQVAAGIRIPDDFNPDKLPAKK
jgi:hypothetical protein